MSIQLIKVIFIYQPPDIIEQVLFLFSKAFPLRPSLPAPPFVPVVNNPPSPPKRRREVWWRRRTFLSPFPWIFLPSSFASLPADGAAFLSFPRLETPPGK